MTERLIACDDTHLTHYAAACYGISARTVLRAAFVRLVVIVGGMAVFAALGVLVEHNVGSFLVWASILLLPGADLHRGYAALVTSRGLGPMQQSVSCFAARSLPVALVVLVIAITLPSWTTSAWHGLGPAAVLVAIGIAIGKRARSPVAPIAALWILATIVPGLTGGRFLSVEPLTSAPDPWHLLVHGLLALAVLAADAWLIFPRTSPVPRTE